MRELCRFSFGLLWLAVAPTPTPSSPLSGTSPPPPSQEARQALNYVAEQYAVPLEDLLLVNEDELSYPLTGRSFRALVIVDRRPPQVTGERFAYNLLIDLATGEIVEDINAVQAAEDAAYRDKYGKLHPTLYDRLQEVTDDTMLPVAIWVAGSAEQRTEAEYYAELAARFPAAAEALARGTKPMDVEDPELSQAIQEAYNQLRAEDTQARIQPLAAWLEAQGFSVESYGAMPSLTATLPKSTILEIEARDDVAMIYLIEEQGSVTMTTAAAPDRVSAVWQRGLEILLFAVGGAIGGLIATLALRRTNPAIPLKQALVIVIGSASGVAVLGLGLVIVGYGTATSQELPFETIEQSPGPLLWESQQPGLLIIATGEEAEDAAQFVNDEAALALSRLDFTRHFAILAFRGRQPTGHDGFRVERVVRQGNEVVLDAQPGLRSGHTLITSPYHLIKVRKEGQWGRTFTFKLYFGEDGQAVAAAAHFIP
jgi:hypothetical protein